MLIVNDRHGYVNSSNKYVVEHTSSTSFIDLREAKGIRVLMQETKGKNEICT